MATSFLKRFLCIGALSFQTAAWAHGDLHEQITAVTAKIHEQPNNVELILRRAELHRLHGEFPPALRDCDRAEKLDAKLASSDFVRGKVFFDSGDLTKARVALDRFLKSQPKHVEALVTRARTLIKLREYELAAADFSVAIANAHAPEPDFFLERAQAWQSATQVTHALESLDDGVAKLGHVASLELPAIALDLQLRRFDDALARVDALAAQSARKDIWLARRAEILERAGRSNEARAEFEKAAAALEEVPAARRQNETSQKLRAEITAGLKRLAAK